MAARALKKTGLLGGLLSLNITDLVRTELERKYFVLENQTMLEMPEMEYEWMVRNLLNRDGINMITGHPGCGKTWIRMDIEFRLALGLPVMGFESPDPLRVLAIDAESGARRTKIRMTKLIAGYAAKGIEIPTDLPIARYLPDEIPGARRIDLMRPETADMITKLATDYRADVITLDPLCRVQSGDIMDANKMLELFHILDRIRHDTGAGIIIVHHLRKGNYGDDPAQAAAGSFAIGAEMATHLSLTRHNNGNIQCRQAKVRDGDHQQGWNVRIEDIGDCGVAIERVEYAKKPKQTKADIAKREVLAAVSGGISLRTDVIAHVTANAHVGERAIDTALAELVVNGVLARDGGVGKIPATYTLVSQCRSVATN